MNFADGAEVVRQRSHGRCEAGLADCDGQGIQTHHRQARGMGGVSRAGLAVNRPSALVRLCLPCHSWVESHRTAAEDLGLLVRRPTVPAEVPVFLRTVNGAGWWILTGDGCYEPTEAPTARAAT